MAPRGSKAIVLYVCLFVVLSECALARTLLQEPEAEPVPEPEAEPESALPKCCDALTALNFTSNLPILILDTAGENVTDVPNKQVKATLPRTNATLCSCGGQGVEGYDGRSTIRVRGSSSVTAAKKSLSLKLEKKNGKSNKFPFLGLPENDEWILYGPESDFTMGIRNKLTFDFFMRMGRWATRTRYVEMFLIEDNQTLSLDHYYGVILAGERISRAEDRVNISKLDPQEDLSGGYIIKYENDNIEAGDVTFEVAAHTPPLTMVYEYPGSSKMPANVSRWISGYFDDFVTALKSGGNWTSYVDVGSVIDYFIATEISKNPDGYRGSVYMWKDKEDVLNFGPPWDYNEAYGICCGFPIEGYERQGVSNGSSGGSAISPEGWRFNICQDRQRCIADPVDGISSWYRAMWQEESFRVRAADRWAELRRGPISTRTMLAEINNLNTTIYDASMRNYERWWDDALMHFDFSNPQRMYNTHVRGLSTWLAARLAWLDIAFQQAPNTTTVLPFASG